MNLQPDEVVGRTLYDYLGTDDAATPVIAAHFRALDGQSSALENEWAGRVFETQVEPLTDEQGKVIGTIGVALDVTDWRTTEQRLNSDRAELQRGVAARSAELETIYEALTDGLLIADVETKRLVQANPAICNMLGYSRKEILEMTIHDLHPPEFVDRGVHTFDTHSRNADHVKAEFLMQRKDGSVFPVDVTASAITYRGRKSMTGLFRDATERKLAEDRLRASEARHRELIENVNSIILRMDVEGRITFFNKFAESYFGYSREEIIGRSVLGTIVPKVDTSGRDLVEHICHVCRHPEQHPTDDNENVKRDGTRVWVSWSNRPVLDDQGRVVEILCVGNDITARRRAEEALQEDQRRLRELVESHERERKLVSYEIHDGLAQKLVAAKMQMDVFHDLRKEQPDVAERAFEAGYELLAKTVSEARRMITGLRPPILDECGVVPAIEHLICEIDPGEKPATELVAQPGIGRFDPLSENIIYRIVQESLSNARRHSQSDRVRIELAQSDGRLRICVQDWGVGFDPSDLPPSGYGLRGIRQRAAALGGCVTLHSTPGEGTELTVEIPVRNA